MKKLLVIAVAALALAACTQEKSVVPGEPGEITITAKHVSTRSALQVTEGETPSYNILWDAPDCILVGYAGIDPVEFKSRNESPAAETSFFGKLPEGSGNLYGIYPATKGNVVNSDGSFTIALKNEQTAVAGSYDPEAFPSVAVSDSKNLSFQNVCGLLALKVENDDVTQIVLSETESDEISVDDNQAAGSRNAPQNGIPGGILTVAIEDGVPAVTEFTETLQCIVLNAPDGGVFSPEETYYMAVAPYTFSKGVTFTVVRQEGESFSVVYNESKSVERNKVHSVEVLEMPVDVFAGIQNEAFHTFCLQNYDANKDGVLTQKEAEAVTSMDVSSQALSSLDGIWLFPNLTYLDCSSNELTSLCLNKNTKLDYLDCRENPGLLEIWLSPGQQIAESHIPGKKEPAIELKVNGQYAVCQEARRSLTFVADVKPELTTDSITWISNLPGFEQVTHQYNNKPDTLYFSKVSELIINNEDEGKLFKMYAQASDGTRSNPVRFGIIWKDPIIYFEKPAQHSEAYLNEKVVFSLFFYPGEGESGTPSIKTYGEGCSRSFMSGVKIQEDESIYWSKTGEKWIVVYFEKNGQRAIDTLFVNVVKPVDFIETDALPGD